MPEEPNRNVVIPPQKLNDALQGLLQKAANEDGLESAGFALEKEQIDQFRAIAAQVAAQGTDSVFATSQDRLTSLLQAYIAENADQLEKPQDDTGLEAKFDTRDLVGWAGSFFHWAGSLHPHDWIAPPETPWTVPDRCRLAVVADWGSGLYGAPVIAESIGRDSDGFDIILHLGDVYYAGTEKEVRTRFIDLWPSNARLTSLATNGNHEMYSGGYGYFDTLLPELAARARDTTMRQKSSCFALQNTNFLMVGLDTAYQDHAMNELQVLWLRRVIKQAGSRKVVLFSHHQPYSQFETQGPKLVSALGELLSSGRIFAWYWGHEHRLVIFDQHPQWRLYGRCIGHGGMPYFRDKFAGSSPGTTAFYSQATKDVAGIRVPASNTLDGPNPYLGDNRSNYGPNGFVTLLFDGDQINESYRLPDNQEVRNGTIR